MNAPINFSEESQSIAYGNAHFLFGADAVDPVVYENKWGEKYPDVIKGIDPSDVKRYMTILPAEIVYEIAGREECRYDFYTTPDGEYLFPRTRHADPSAESAFDAYIKKDGFRQVPNQQALLEYGVYCMYRAVDIGSGVKKGYTGR